MKTETKLYHYGYAAGVISVAVLLQMIFKEKSQEGTKFIIEIIFILILLTMFFYHNKKIIAADERTRLQLLRQSKKYNIKYSPNISVGTTAGAYADINTLNKQGLLKEKFLVNHPNSLAAVLGQAFLTLNREEEDLIIVLAEHPKMKRSK
jgi:20S proteasome alpha/beta subunit